MEATSCNKMMIALFLAGIILILIQDIWASTNVTQKCFNGGTPSFNESLMECSCTENMTGSHCENTSINMTQTCFNGGTSFYNQTTLECLCPDNTTGSRCENTSTNMTQTCFNGGTPSYIESTLECTCPENTTGSRCEITICSLFECYNHGTAVLRDEFCECACPEHFTGIVCETELRPSQWPDGPYALLMTTSGCPESTNHGWGTGFIRFTTTRKMEIWREFNYSNGDVKRMRLAENTSSLAGPFQNYSFQLNFCFKHTNSLVVSSTAWPELNVTVYGDREGCPYGFDEDINDLPLPPLGSWWHDGYLPYFEIHDDANESLLKTKHCHIKESKINNTGYMGNKEPFILVKEYGHRCPSVTGFDPEEETLQFISTGDYHIGKRLQTNLSFCFYKQEEVNYMYPSSWPNGPYAVLMPNTGCPEPLNYGWKVSYMQLEYPLGLSIYSRIDECQSVHMLGTVLGSYHRRYVQIFFCFKHGQQDNANANQWPSGNYSILGTDKGCPEGFQENYRLFRISPSGVLATTGPLPSYEVHEWDDQGYVLKLKFCDKTDEYMEFSPDWKKPFLFSRPEGSNCVDEVKGFTLRELSEDGLDACMYIPDTVLREECFENEMKCGSGECVKRIHVCDNIRDCRDGSDEQHDHCGCESNTFPCRKGERIICVTKYVICNGNFDCDEFNDEAMSKCPLICNQGELYRGKSFRWNRKTPVCMSTDDDTESSAALGLRAFCKNRERCTKVNDICDELLPQAIVDKQLTTPCQRALGLMDGSIKDSELVSSSYENGHQAHMARPTKSSWCPHKNETEPFLEVMLNYVTVVGGLILYNSVEIGGTIVNNSYIPEAIPVGCGAFSIQYALFENKYRQYSNEFFEVDESMEIDKLQRFTFLRPFLARYVRIYPLKKILNGSMCLKIELLGCPQSGDESLRISLSKVEQFNLLISGSYELSDMTRSSDTIYRWNITVPVGGYIKLSFLTINLYNQSGLYPESCPQDFITFNKLFEPITAEYNKQTPTFPTDTSSLLMSFVSCAREAQGHSSFAIRFNKEDVPTIWNSIKDINIVEGKIITFSLLGLFINLPDWQIWFLDSIVHGRPLVLTVQNLNIPCDSAFQLVIRVNEEYQGDYLCNTEQLSPRKTYKAWILHISFLCSDAVSLYDPEGFSAVYRIEPVPEKQTWFDENEGYEPPTDVRQLGVYTVYSQTAGKQYRFSYQTGFEDWRTQAKRCQRLNSTLVVIHRRSELEFLKSWIFYRIIKLFTTKNERPSAVKLKTNSFKWRYSENVYFHIGLLRYRGINGIKEIWQDGTYLSFTAWGTGEPKSVSSNKCTGMQVNMTTGEGRWVTRACNEDSIETTRFMFASICEKQMVDIPSADDYSNNIDARVNPNATRMHAVKLFRCNSTEWVSHLAKCDGIPDCIDGSDETGCRPNRTDTCSGDMFLCKTGECIPVGKVCNYINDCTDKSDEYCDKSPCTDEEFQCINQQCIPSYHRCNAVNDCLDGTDEVLCETCNKTTAHRCVSEMTCKDKSMVCDNTRDCADGSDETNCDPTYNSCIDYGRAGRDRNVSIDHSDASMECQFNATEDILIITTYVIVKKTWITFFSDSDFTLLWVTDFSGLGDSCVIQVTLFCPEYNTDTSCNSETYNIHLKNNSFSGNDFHDYQLTIDVESNSISIRRVKKQGNRLIRFHPAICKSEPMDISQIIRCGDGKTVSSRRECLYDINRNGFIDGCLNYKHLENCENFTCPEGYFKCPFSFCLARRYICDGERQCPGGEDEFDCWCMGNRNNTVIIYHEEFNRSVVPIIHQFARQLYSPNAEVYSVRYYFNSTVQAFIVYKSPVHPYNDGLYLGEVENFTIPIPMYKLYDEIPNILNMSERINIINIEQNDGLQHKGNFSNSSLIDHIYHISNDPNLRQRATVTTAERESVLKLNDWILLASAGSTLFPKLCQAKTVAKCAEQFRCLSSKVCIPVDQICDGNPQCPFEDDEVMCDFQCHTKCTCHLYTAYCQATNFTKSDFVELAATVRVFDMSENLFEDNKLEIPKHFPYLVTLIAKNCGIISVEGKTFQNATNIRRLDISFNIIKVITTTTFEGLTWLEELNLKGNFYIESIQPKAFKMLTSLSALTLTNTSLWEIHADTFWGLNVKVLDISHNRIRRMHKRSFNNLSAMEIDFYGNDVEEFDVDIFSDIKRLEIIRSPAYKFCCVKPSSLSDDNCWPHQDEFSSCEDLMRNPILQTLVWVLGAAAVVSNGCTVFYRLVYDRKSLKKGFSMFVTNLAVSDFLMGVYMVIIAVADITFRSRYIMMDDYWRNSIWCGLAGVLATVSSEASVLFMCLITLDRILVIKYPFGQLKFSPKSSKIASLVSWIIALIIALVPILVQDYFEGKFYSTSGVCLALPLTHRRPPGWLYSFLIYVGLNFMVFIMIAIGQLVIYLEIKASSKRMRNVRSQRRNDIRIAKNLLLVLTTDFLCWFPVGVMAILAARGYVIPAEMYAWTAVLIVPINAALNPFLYTLSSILHKKTGSMKGSVTERSINQQTIVSQGTKKRQNVGKNTIVADTPNVHVNTLLDEVQPGHITLEPGKVLLAYIATAKYMVFTHENNHVCGGFNIRDVLYSKEGKKIRIYNPCPIKSGDKHDKEKDILELGCVLEHLLKFTKAFKMTGLVKTDRKPNNNGKGVNSLNAK